MSPTKRRAAIGIAVLAVSAIAWRVTHPRAAPPADAVVASASPSAVVDAAVEARVYPQWSSVPNEALPPKGELAPGTLRVLVVGDSEAKFFGNVMRFRQATANTFVAQRGVGSCSIHPADDGSSCASDWVTDVAALEPDVTFIILGGGFLGPKTCDPGWRKRYADRLTFLLRAIAPHAGRIVLALVPYPGERWRVPNTIQLVDCFNDELTKVARTEHADTLDLIGHVCPTTDCIQTSEGWPVRNDGLHFDGPGAHETADWTLGELRRIALTPPSTTR